MRVFVVTSDKYLWALEPFAFLFNKYWEAEVVIGGFSEPQFDLPPNFKFHSIGEFSDYPVNRWSDALIKFLNEIDDEEFIWMMEDYWLTRPVDRNAISLLSWYMRRHPEIARIDLTSDRLYAANLKESGPLGRIDLITNDPPAPYHFSLQAGMWRKNAMLKYLVPSETPWETEINGSNRMTEDRAVVLGTRQFPVRYLIAVQGGALALDGGYQVPAPFIKPEDRMYFENVLPEVVL